MIQEAKGNLLESPAEALINTVNTVGVMGKGIALQFARAFPENLAAYEVACEKGEVQPGRMFIHENRALTGPKFIINFPTKRHWRSPSRIEDIESGLEALISDVKRLNIRSVAMPPLGCGNGGLNWLDVRPRIEAAFAALPDVTLSIFAPSGAPEATRMRTSAKRPRMTDATAATVGILARYSQFDYRLSLLEVHKLVYFLQIAGEPMPRTIFSKGPYGPYADALRHVLTRLEGHYLSGWGDATRNKPDTIISLLPGASEEATHHLGQKPETHARFDRVAALIDGFETPMGLELLSTVHWVIREKSSVENFDAILRGVHEWNDRKKNFFPEPLVRVAFNRLSEQGWISPTA